MVMYEKEFCFLVLFSSFISVLLLLQPMVVIYGVSYGCQSKHNLSSCTNLV